MSSNYLESVQNHPELKSLREALIGRVEEVMEKANAKKDSYLDYAYLWTDSRYVCLDIFFLFVLCIVLLHRQGRLHAQLPSLRTSALSEGA